MPLTGPVTNLGRVTVRSPLEVTREQVLSFRQRAGALDERLAPGAESLRRAAWAGLQDSMPRAAQLSLHARVDQVTPSAWEDPSLVQLWGPRFTVFVVAARDHAVFSLGTLPDDDRGLLRAQTIAARLHAFLDGARMNYEEAGRGLGLANANMLRYAAATGTVLIRWEGARRPVVWTVPPPDVDPAEARLELARRYLHVYGPATQASFAQWSGTGPRAAAMAFEALRPSLAPVRTPIGEAWILAEDEAAVRDGTGGLTGPVRLLPSGDPYLVLQGADRELVVPDAGRRGELWTPRVWPGGLLIGGEIAGTWRRADTVLTVQTWRRLSGAERDAVVAEAESLPLPGITRRMVVRWTEP
jgi:Winged helix DNA-binding domain